MRKLKKQLSIKTAARIRISELHGSPEAYRVLCGGAGLVACGLICNSIGRSLIHFSS
jgi:hypothetical protein